MVSETVTGTFQGGVISPLLANVYLHALDRAWVERGAGEVVRYADDFVVLCTSQSQAEKAGGGRSPSSVGSGWPSIRTRPLWSTSEVGDEASTSSGATCLPACPTGSRGSTGNAPIEFSVIDKDVWWRLFRLMCKKRGRRLRAGHADRWTSAWFHDQGLYHLPGTIRYPKAASPCPEERR